MDSVRAWAPPRPDVAAGLRRHPARTPAPAAAAARAFAAAAAAAAVAASTGSRCLATGGALLLRLRRSPLVGHGLLHGH
eukprot:359236-Chlamydomonas_euryale.AAC.15